MKRVPFILTLLAMLGVATTAVAQADDEDAIGPASVAAMRSVLNRAIKDARAADAVASENPIEATRLYRDALAGFCELRASGVRTAGIEYNIATLYARLEEPGRSIAASLRAARLAPHDARIERTLTYARWLRDGRIARAAASPASRPRAWNDALTGDWVWPVVVAWNVGWLVVFRRVWGGRRHGVFLVALGLIAVLMGLGVAAAPRIHSSEIDGVIVFGDVLPRKGCGENYDPALRLSPPNGTEFRWIETRDDGRGEPWFRVGFADGVEAWIPAETAELIE